MNLIYVASPYRGDVEKNVVYAKACCNFVLEQGCNFFCPHLMYTQVLDDDIAEERAIGLEMGRAMITKCDALWTFGDTISEGMQAEMDYAKANGIAVEHISNAQLEMKPQVAELRLC